MPIRPPTRSRRFEERDGDAELLKAVGAGEAGDSSADDGDLFGSAMVSGIRLECFREQRPLVHLLFAKIAVEDHGHVADEDAAERRDANFVGIESDQALRRGVLRGAASSGAKYSSKEMENSRSISCLGITVWQSRRPITARRSTVVGAKGDSRAWWRFRGGDGASVRRNFAAILRVGCADAS